MFFEITPSDERFTLIEPEEEPIPEDTGNAAQGAPPAQQLPEQDPIPEPERPSYIHLPEREAANPGEAANPAEVSNPGEAPNVVHQSTVPDNP